MLYKEWSRALYHSGVFVPESKIEQLIKNAPDPGYASVYSFTEKPESASGLTNYEVFAAAITLDLDGGDKELAEAERILIKAGLAYEVWSSGGKGYHVVIPHDGIVSIDLPYSHLNWVRELQLPHDETLYQHGRLLSLPGRIHPKTKRRKTKIKSVGGSKAVVNIIPDVRRETKSIEIGGITELRQALMRLCSSAINGPDKGDRHMSLWKLARDCRKAGWCYETTLDVVHSVNDSWPEPKDIKDVVKAVKGAYR